MVWPFRRKQPNSVTVRHKFSSPVMSIDELFRQLNSVDSGPVTRKQALSVPAVKRGRDLICSIASLPLQLYRQADNTVVDSPLFRQFDLDVPNIVHLAQTVEDLIFESVAWWQITSSDFDGFPMSVRRLDPHTVSIDPPAGSRRSPAPLPGGYDPRDGVIYVDGLPVSGREVIRFDSPNAAVLVVGAVAIRRAVLLDQAAKMYAETPMAQEFFTQSAGGPEYDDEEIQDHLNKWQSHRKKRSTGFVPPGLEHHTVEIVSARDLQLVELQQRAALEIANLIGLWPEDVGVSVTSRDYANLIDRRRDRINDVLFPYMRAITDRLSMGDVTRRGQAARFDLNDYLKPNPTERASIQKTYVDMGVLDADEVRTDEGRAPRVRPAVPPSSIVEDATVESDA